MSYNQPPPNPYGQQPPPPGPPPGYGYPHQGGVPPQHNPYARPAGPQGGNPYAQPPGAPNPYGPPQGGSPYGQQPGAPNPYGQQLGWGGQVPPPPPGKSNTGKIVGIIAAAVVVAAVGIGVVAVSSGGKTTSSGTSGGSGGDGKSSAQYKLTTPQTVAGGYTLQGTGQSAAPSSDQQIPGVSNPTAVAANYQDSDQKVLTFGGNYGSISDPGSVVDATFTAVKTNPATSGKFTFVGTAEEEHPTGFDGTVMKCQQVTMSGALPGVMCVWGDSSTVGEVILVNPKAALTGGGTALDPSAAADITAKVRQDSRVKIS